MMSIGLLDALKLLKIFETFACLTPHARGTAAHAPRPRASGARNAHSQLNTVSICQKTQPISSKGFGENVSPVLHYTQPKNTSSNSQTSLAFPAVNYAVSLDTRTSRPLWASKLHDLISHM